MIGPIVKAVGGLIIKKVPSLVPYAGKRLLPALTGKVANASSSVVRRTVGKTVRKDLLKGAVTSPSVKKGIFGSIGSKMPGWMKKSFIFAGEVVAFNELTELIFGDDKKGNSNSLFDDDDSDVENNAFSNVLIANGHSRLLEDIENEPANEQITNSRINDLTDLVSDVFTSRNSICGSDLPYSLDSRLVSLLPNERGLIITRLVSIIKQVALTSEDPEILLLLSNQAMVSGMVNSSVTNGFDMIMGSNPSDRRKAGIKAAEMNSMFTSLGDEIAEAAYDDFYSSHSSLFDFFDVFEYDGDNEVEGEDSSIAARIARLCTDDSAGAALNMLQKVALDSDGKDDESRALARTVDYSRLSGLYLDFVIGAGLRSQFVMDTYLSR